VVNKQRLQGYRKAVPYKLPKGSPYGKNRAKQNKRMAEKIKGLGDVVAAATKLVGIKPCEECERRRQKWNEMFPIKVKDKIREMTPEEQQAWRDFQAVRTLRLSNEQRKFVCRIYSDVFNVPYYEPCPSCDASPYIKMIDRMDKVIKTYE